MSARWPAVPIQSALVVSHVLTLALPLAVLVATGAWSYDLLHQRQEELSRQAALVAMMVEAEWRRSHDLAPAAVPLRPEGEEGGPPGGAHRVTVLAGEAIDEPDPTLAGLAPELAPMLVRVFHATHAGVRVLDTHGRVLATSGPMLGEHLGDRPEVQGALRGIADVAVRSELPPPLSVPRTDERKTELLTFASATVPLAPDGQIRGVVLLTRPTRGVGDALVDMRRRLGPGSGAALVLTVGLALGFGWRVSRSLRALSAAASRMAEGDWWRDGDGLRGTIQRLEGTRVAEVRALATALRVLSERLEARLRDQQEYAGNVSHEFKTPLATLRGTVDLLAEDADMPPDQRARFLENARTDLDRMDRMVSGLLELARVEAGSEHEEFGMDEVLEAVGARFPAVEVRRGGGRVRGDFAQVELAVMNLVQNAFHHGAPPVKVASYVVARQVVVAVEDHGAGVSGANRERVFERFFTTSAGRKGTGLGLALVRAVARGHGGDVTVAREAGRTVFRMLLPLAPG